MIGEIHGKISKIYDEYIIINVNGVGYVVFLSTKSIENLTIGDEISILIETRFKVDKICLFGFINEFQHKCFHYISSISGISDKIATEISGIFSASDFLFLLNDKDKKNKIKINGVGPKTWEKILFSLERNKNFYNECLQYQSNNCNQNDLNQNEKFDFNNHELYNDVIQALISMGINKNLAKSLLEKSFEALKENSLDINLQNLIKESLKNYHMCN
jgi:Holliday junction DNA helicase RuvA